MQPKQVCCVAMSVRTRGLGHQFSGRSICHISSLHFPFGDFEVHALTS
jgi:hypothetical protein